MPFDEEDLDPHGECAHEIHKLQSALTSAHAHIARLEGEVRSLREALGMARDSIRDNHGYHVRFDCHTWYNVGAPCDCWVGQTIDKADAALSPSSDAAASVHTEVE